jgi:hypothetical protein
MWSGEPGVTRLLVAPGRKVRDAHRQAVTYYVPRANWKRPSRNRDGQREGRPDFAPRIEDPANQSSRGLGRWRTTKRGTANSKRPRLLAPGAGISVYLPETVPRGAQQSKPRL